MRNILWLWIFALYLTSCQSNNQNNVPVVGELDSSAIAQDTALQLGLESSYEYHKTLVVNEKLVYDVVGYGGPPSKGEFVILRRGADNKTDTVMKAIREGIIFDIFLADSNRNGSEEVYVVIQNAIRVSDKKTVRYESQ